MKWKRRTTGTSNQMGKAFPIPEESQQAAKGRLPKVREGFVVLNSYLKKSPTTFIVVYKDASGEEHEATIKADNYKNIVKMFKSEGCIVNSISKAPKEENAFDSQKQL